MLPATKRGDPSAFVLSWHLNAEGDELTFTTQGYSPTFTDISLAIKERLVGLLSDRWSVDCEMEIDVT